MSAARALVAEFDDSERLEAAKYRLELAGFTAIETYSPRPLAAGTPRARRLAAIVLAAGLAGLLLAYFLQWYGAAVDYPINVGGRPLHSAPAFVPIAFEGMAFAAVAATVVAALLLGGLPRLHHPIDRVPGFERATSDRFFLAIEASDPRYDSERLRRLLDGHHPLRVTELGA